MRVVTRKPSLYNFSFVGDVFTYLLLKGGIKQNYSEVLTWGRTVWRYLNINMLTTQPTFSWQTTLGLYNFKKNFRIFKEVSKLKLNWNRSSFSRIGISSGWKPFATSSGCKRREWPILFLGSLWAIQDHWVFGACGASFHKNLSSWKKIISLQGAGSL